MRRLRFGGMSRFLVLLAVLGSFATVYSQRMNTARLLGTVTDQQQALVPAATVLVRNELTGFSRTVTTNERGYYEADLLPIGLYTLTATKEGFQTFEQKQIRLEAGQSVRVDAALLVGSVGTTVTVDAAPPPVNSTSAELTNLIDTRRVLDLPTRQRSLSSFFALNASVQQPYAGGRTTLSLNGSPQIGSNFTIDGTDTTTIESQSLRIEYTATPLVAASVESIAEFKITAGIKDASVARSASGSVNIITKSGTNEYHGSLFEFWRGNVLNALNATQKALGFRPAHFVTNQFGGSLGAPIIKNRLFYFLSYEGQRQRTGSFTQAVMPTASWKRGLTDPLLIDLFSRLPEPNLPIQGRDDIGLLAKNFSPETGADLATGKIDWNIGSNDSLFVRSNVSLTRTKNPNVTPAFAAAARYQQQTFTLGYNHVFSPITLNEFRVGANNVLNLNSTMNFTDLGLMNTQDGFGYFEQLITLPGPGRTWTIADNFSHRFGQHNIRFGLEIYTFGPFEERVHQPPSYSFRTMADLQRDRPFLASFIFGPTGKFVVPIDRTYYGFYVQDEYRLRRNLTLSLAARGSSQTKFFAARTFHHRIVLWRWGPASNESGSRSCGSRATMWCGLRGTRFTTG